MKIRWMQLDLQWIGIGWTAAYGPPNTPKLSGQGGKVFASEAEALKAALDDMREG